jgi:heme peroxidase
MTAQHQPAGRILRDIRHGGEVLPDDAKNAREDAEFRAGISLASAAVPGVNLEADDVTTPFGYLFDSIKNDPAAHLPADDPATVAAVVEALRALGKALAEEPLPTDDVFGSAGNSTIPTVFTYLGQFVDHDLTANTDRGNELGNVSDFGLHPVAPDEVTEKLRNLRLPQLNLDSVYGDGPTFPGEPTTAAADLYDGIKLKVGTVALAANSGAPAIAGVRIPLEADLARDLPRDADGLATIGDARNDENLIVAQLHTAFLRFHNATVDWVRAHESHADERAVFTRAQQLARWHYQWIVVNDFLPTIALPGVVDQVLVEGNTLFEKRAGEVYMPLEFSVAAYRFGHSMVRGGYDFNRNFGRPGRNRPSATFNLLFTFTGRGGFFGATDVLPFNWVIEWDRFVETDPRFPDHFARKIDTNLAPPLFTMANEVQGVGDTTPDEIRIHDILERLAVRNLLRGYQLSLPTGQAVARALNLTPLSSAELKLDNSDAINEALTSGGFLERTPLWYYVLKEAEVRADGNSLGELGSRIVVETIVGQVRNDDDSYLSRTPEWTPEQGVRLPDGQPVRTIKDLLRFAGVLPTRP